MFTFLLNIMWASLMTQWWRICLQFRSHRRHEFDPWVRKIPWRRTWQPTLVFLPGESHDWGAWQAMVHRVIKSRTWLKWPSIQTLCRMLVMWSISQHKSFNKSDELVCSWENKVKFLKNVLVSHASLITSGKRHKVIIYSFVNQNY